MEITPGFRRVAPEEPLPESDEILLGRIRDEIVATGPMTFTRFMELALYDPERGYYSTAEVRAGRTGDFLTAPETHPIFGHAVARVLDEMWRALDRPDPFTLREYGAGSGTLALAIVRGLQADGSSLLDALRYEPVEIGAARQAELVERFAGAGFGDRLAVGGSSERIVGCVLANEFLDALPVHRVIQRDGALREVYVGWEPDGSGGGRLVDMPGPPSTPGLAGRLALEGITLVEGQRGEICLALDAWVAEVGRTLERGYVLVIDYGRPATALYGPDRLDGTLRSYVRHRAGDDPYRRVGRQDLTAHVDLTALENAGARAGLTTLGVTTQAELLVGAGAESLLVAIQADPATTLPEYLELRAALWRMLDPGAMGRFRVVVLGRDVPSDVRLAALAYRLAG
jgi:SAM-dependent MidA family methyltransferase